MQFSSCYSYVASYNKLNQLPMQMLLNRHLAAFLELELYKKAAK